MVDVFGDRLVPSDNNEVILVRLLIVSILLLTPAVLRAQVVAAGRGGQQTVWAGAEYSNYTPDFGPAPRLSGIGVYVNLNWNSRWGVDGEARYLRFQQYHGQHEDNYLAGPRATLLRRGRFRPYAKLMLGAGDITFPFQIGSGTYFVYAPAGGVDYRLNLRFRLRAEYQYQFWPGAPGIPNEPSRGLNPNGLNVGLAFRIH